MWCPLSISIMRKPKKYLLASMLRLGVENQKFQVQQFVSPKKYDMESLRFEEIELGPQSGEIYKTIKT